MATRTQKDEAWCAVLDEMEAWAMLRRQPDCPRETQIHLDDLLSRAPLIRAAPDLLAALKVCMAALERLGASNPPVREAMERTIRQGNAALAKASA